MYIKPFDSFLPFSGGSAVFSACFSSFGFGSWMGVLPKRLKPYGVNEKLKT